MRRRDSCASIAADPASPRRNLSQKFTGHGRQYDATYRGKTRAAASRGRLSETRTAQAVQRSGVLTERAGVPRLIAHVVTIPVSTHSGMAHVVVVAISAEVGGGVVFSGIEAGGQVTVCLELLPRVLAVQRILTLGGGRAVRRVIVVHLEVMAVHPGR